MKTKIKLVLSIILLGIMIFLISPLSDGLHQAQRDKIEKLETEYEKDFPSFPSYPYYKNNSEIIKERKRDEDVLKRLYPNLYDPSHEESSEESSHEESSEEHEEILEESSHEESSEESSHEEISDYSIKDINIFYEDKIYEWNSEIYYLASIIENEAGGLYEEDDFLKKVGSVAINRLKSGKHGNNFYEVASENGVYQGLMDYIPYPSERFQNEWELKSFLHSYEIAENLIENGSILPSDCLCQSGYILGDIYDTYYSEEMDSTCYFCRENFSTLDLYYQYYPK